MSSTTATTGRLDYGRRLFDAGIAGARAGRDQFDPETTSELLTESAQASLKLAAFGACLGLLPALLLRRRRVSAAAAFGALGSALGFCAAFSWKTRKLTSAVGHSALREVRRVQDEHWLEGHPIDYA